MSTCTSGSELQDRILWIGIGGPVLKGGKRWIRIDGPTGVTGSHGWTRMTTPE